MLYFLVEECLKVKPDTLDAIKYDRYGVNYQGNAVKNY